MSASTVARGNRSLLEFTAGNIRKMKPRQSMEWRSNWSGLSIVVIFQYNAESGDWLQQLSLFELLYKGIPFSLDRR